MADEIRGIEKPEDIRTRRDALRLLDIDESADSEDINDAVQAVTLDSHPDARGTEELFKAVQLAEDALTGEALIDPDGGRAPQDDPSGINISIVGLTEPPDRGRTREREPGEREPGPFGGFGADPTSGGGVGFQDVDPGGIVDEVEALLRENLTEQELKDKFGEVATFENVSEVIAAQIIQGQITLGNLGNVIGSETFTGSTESATGGFFSDDPRGSPFGSSDFFSSNTRDVRYSPSNAPDDEDGDEGGGSNS